MNIFSKIIEYYVVFLAVKRSGEKWYENLEMFQIFSGFLLFSDMVLVIHAGGKNSVCCCILLRV